jgi:hypothetical protein
VWERSVSLLGELVAQIIGEAAVEAFRGNKKPRAPFPEGDTKASYGAASAFLGSVGVLLVVPVALVAALVGPSPEMSLSAILVVTAISLALCIGGMRLGAKAPLVTRRNLGMAKYGLIASLVGALSAGVTVVACAARAIL